jgi:hypothetical protein
MVRAGPYSLLITDIAWKGKELHKIMTVAFFLIGASKLFNNLTKSPFLKTYNSRPDPLLYSFEAKKPHV